MIRISKIADYSVLILSHMAQHRDATQFSARSLAEATKLPLPMVSKILKELTKANLLLSHRGSHGGYRLARTPEKIKITQILEAVDGPFGLTQCTSGPGSCNMEHCCGVRANWSKVSATIFSSLLKVSLADMIEPLPACGGQFAIRS